MLEFEPRLLDVSGLSFLLVTKRSFRTISLRALKTFFPIRRADGAARICFCSFTALPYTVVNTNSRANRHWEKKKKKPRRNHFAETWTRTLDRAIFQSRAECAIHLATAPRPASQILIFRRQKIMQIFSRARSTS